ncbi:DUF2971 domain-containing protein [Clostridium perfringens]|uniref:DUF2971 domain-containing protein n=1 Tax=Clostridium perfringens TaxID=1502 RepID=UPI0013E3E567|nr:DUF2971 domain-containing protein [Clostridium perfringens]EIF6153936.1 DUF2971 domain-containing protein [Clostridium perfringens]MBO3395044.1 DUF2971 domain-containing protein [Clostridium perfringens]MBO3400857.1 DUF2971 domain-containing protein [Clostridium perfringens]MCX0365293.1 DUF2971 domain-containing protein [Clostridium perfringens]MDJ9034278.1 DUF2971 domain-containing protein [Clostridium perfringens]
MNKELLYHYTSIETLALILKNKTICFNNLLLVDDLEEAETRDMGNFGKYVNVSCWTSDYEESIPLWNLYTSKMRGVRIGLPKFPFKKYKFKKGMYGLTEDVETFLNLEKIYHENKASILAEMPLLLEVEYTDDHEKLTPAIRECNDIDGMIKFIKTGEIGNNKSISSKYNIIKLGKFKRKNWSFQKELRYVINCSPTPIKEFEFDPSIDKHREFFRRIEDENYPAPYEKIFLEIDDKCLNNIEILIGPKVTEGEKIIIKSLIDTYCPKANLKESKLRIR